mgnify:CR=1 FL=1
MAATTETTAGAAPTVGVVDRLREAFGRLESRQKMILAAAIAAIEFARGEAHGTSVL